MKRPTAVTLHHLMLLVIFGAGASHGSAEPSEGVRPAPLAKQLLDYPEIAAEYSAG